MAEGRRGRGSSSKPDTIHQPTFAANPQKESMLFEILPQELRDKIYSALFFSTRFSSGGRSVTRNDYIRIRPALNALSVLQTCRRAKMEIGESWISQVLFSFEDPETMLDKLTSLPPGILSKIRHLRVSGDPLMLCHEDDDVYYRLGSTLLLLPGLRLDVMTVLGARGKYVSYDTLNRLIREGCGWKELRYISPSSGVLGFARLDILPFPGDDEGVTYWRKPQPSHWQSVLQDRDGPVTMPSVTIYRSTMPGCPGSVINTKTRAVFEQKLPEDKAAQEAFGITEDARVMSAGERDKEMMVIVKRGSGIDYEQKKDSPFIECDIRAAMPGKTWKEIRYECLDHLFDDGNDCQLSDDRDEGGPADIDAYEDVDEYIWPL